MPRGYSSREVANACKHQYLGEEQLRNVERAAYHDIYGQHLIIIFKDPRGFVALRVGRTPKFCLCEHTLDGLTASITSIVM